MNQHKIGSDKWYELNKIAKGCRFTAGRTYIVEKDSVISCHVWAGGSEQPLWFADEYNKEDGDIYYKERMRAVCWKSTIFRKEVSNGTYKDE